MQWLFFILGQVINVLRQAKLVAGSGPEKNPIGSKWRWIYRNAVGLMIREVAAITFWLLLTHPMAGPALLEMLRPDWGQYAQILIEIPFLACPFGVCFSIWADERMESWPWLKKHIPALGNGR